MNKVLLNKIKRIISSKFEATLGGMLYNLDDTLAQMAIRPFELHLELTNICNANCIFCPYQFQEREPEIMGDEVFQYAITSYMECGGGSVSLTPIVGDALIDPKFLQRVRFLRCQPKIDRIFLVTNGILLDKFGIEDVLTSGVSSITISTSGFDEKSYARIYRSSAYHRMRNNVQALVEANTKLGGNVNITIGLRSDRSLDDLMNDPDFVPILAHKPNIDFTWSYTSAGGRITSEMLGSSMKLRKSPRKKEACVNLYNGPIVLPNGDVLGCSCVAAIDAIKDLKIGNIGEKGLLEIWVDDKISRLRKQFEDGSGLNVTCKACDMYRNLDLYRTNEGRTRAKINKLRSEGKLIMRESMKGSIFGGG